MHAETRMRLAWRISLIALGVGGALLLLIGVISLIGLAMQQQLVPQPGDPPMPALWSTLTPALISLAGGILALCTVLLRKKQVAGILALLGGAVLTLSGAVLSMGLFVAARSTAGNGAGALTVIGFLFLLLALSGIWAILTASHPQAPHRQIDRPS